MSIRLVDDGLRRLVLVVVEGVDVVVPVANARIGLPRLGENALGLAALDVERDGADVIRPQALAVDDYVQVSFVADRGVVIVRREGEPILLEG